MTNTQALIVAVVVVALVAVALIVWQRSRAQSAHLKDRFGSEYDRAVSSEGSERKAEARLAEREKRVSKYKIRPLEPQMRAHFVDTWQKVQAQFVDDPSYAVTRADDLLGEVMGARGYPVSDFDQASEDLSVDHGEVVQNYRKGHDIALAHKRGEASTEDLRTAMIHYRALFDDLVNEPEVTREPA